MAPEATILYIEDERPVLELVRQTFIMVGYNFVGATSGREGMNLMRQSPPSVLLLDLMMPDFNGWDVYREMKRDKVLARIPVIVVTATIPTNSHIIVKGLPPADDYITKPFDIEQLIRAVQNFLT